MKESIELFRDIMNLNVFEHSHMILFLNKSDLFEKKVGEYPIKEHFEEFEGKENSWDVITFFKQKFKDQKTLKNKRKEIHFHVSCATDTACIKKMFESVRTIIIRSSWHSYSGFL